MSANTINKLYEWLKPEERFRLILAAGARGDMAERDRLSEASRSVAFKVRDFFPWAQAFNELAMIMFLEFVETAARQNDAIQRCQAFQGSRKRAPTKRKTANGRDANSEKRAASAELSADEAQEMRLFDMFLADGFILKTKVDGWKLFCERLNLPPLAIWEVLPGYERFATTVKQLEGTKTRPGAAFLPGGMLRFLRENRLAGQPEPTEAGLITADKVADELDEMFRDTVKKHGG